MKKKIFQVSVVIAILSLGFGLRLWKYPFYPLVGHAEEYAFVWHGLSTIEEGAPISWSMLPPYEKKHIVWQGEAPNPGGGGGLGVQLVKPWFDQTPLFSLIVGAAAKLYNQTNFTLISPYIIRIPSLIFSFMTMIFLFILAKKYFGFWMGALSLLIYATIPTVVFGSRMVVPENMIVMLMIVSLWLILGYLETEAKWKRNLAIFLAVAAAFAKATGFLLVPFVVFWLLKDRRWREGVVVGIVGSLLFFIPYFAYGFYVDRELFLKVLFYQAQRPAGWSGLAFLIANPGFSIEVFLDGFLILGFFALVYLLFKKRDKGEEIILFSFVFSLLVVIISGGRHDQLAWYRYPIYPYMAVAIALLVKEIYERPTFFSSAIFIPLVLSNVDLLENPFWKIKFFIESRFYRLAFALLLIPSVFQFFSQKEIWLRLSRVVIILVFITGIVFNIWVVKSWFNLLCDNTICPLPQKVDLLEVFPGRGGDK